MPTKPPSTAFAEAQMRARAQRQQNERAALCLYDMRFPPRMRGDASRAAESGARKSIRSHDRSPRNADVRAAARVRAVVCVARACGASHHQTDSYAEVHAAQNRRCFIIAPRSPPRRKHDARYFVRSSCRFLPRLMTPTPRRVSPRYRAATRRCGAKAKVRSSDWQHAHFRFRRGAIARDGCRCTVF